MLIFGGSKKYNSWEVLIEPTDRELADRESQLYSLLPPPPLYIRDLRICRRWYPQGLLEPIPCGY